MFGLYNFFVLWYEQPSEPGRAYTLVTQWQHRPACAFELSESNARPANERIEDQSPLRNRILLKRAIRSEYRSRLHCITFQTRDLRPRSNADRSYYNYNSAAWPYYDLMSPDLLSPIQNPDSIQASDFLFCRQCLSPVHSPPPLEQYPRCSKVCG